MTDAKEISKSQGRAKLADFLSSKLARHGAIAELSALSGVDRGTINTYKDKKNKTAMEPLQSTLESLSKGLKLTPDSLFNLYRCGIEPVADPDAVPPVDQLDQLAEDVAVVVATVAQMTEDISELKRAAETSVEVAALLKEVAKTNADVATSLPEIKSALIKLLTRAT